MGRLVRKRIPDLDPFDQKSCLLMTRPWTPRAAPRPLTVRTNVQERAQHDEVAEMGLGERE
jgi:hypothetical protein